MMQSPRLLNLVWGRKTLDFIMEGYFIREVLLGELGRPVRLMAFERGARLPELEDALVVSFNDELAEYLRYLRSRGCRNIGLLHLADEKGDSDRSFYGSADYVLRHYWFKDALEVPNDQCLGVIWVPAGYRTGSGPIAPSRHLPIGDRTIMGFFAGHVGKQPGRRLAERQHMMSVVHEAGLPFHMVNLNDDPSVAFGTLSYMAYMSSARFALVPGGGSPETVRLYEALEAGAIPIMLRSPVVQAADGFDNPPFILLDTWAQLPAAYAPFADANAPAVISALEGKRREVVDWWSKFKTKQQHRVKELIDRSFSRASRQDER